MTDATKTHAPARPDAPRKEAAPTRFPDLQVIRRLGTHRLAARWLLREAHSHQPLLAHALHLPGSPGEQDRASARARNAAAFRHPHALSVSRVHADGDTLWLVSPYPGSYDGLLTLSALLSMKAGGQFEPAETRHAVAQVLGALSAGRSAGCAHGPVRMDEVLVDRHARVLIELFGVEQALIARPDDRSTETEELVSVGAMASELLSGVPWRPGGVGLPVRTRRTRAWNAWIERAGTAGFATLDAALDALP